MGNARFPISGVRESRVGINVITQAGRNMLGETYEAKMSMR